MPVGLFGLASRQARRAAQRRDAPRLARSASSALAPRSRPDAGGRRALSGSAGSKDSPATAGRAHRLHPEWRERRARIRPRSPPSPPPARATRTRRNARPCSGRCALEARACRAPRYSRAARPPEPAARVRAPRVARASPGWPTSIWIMSSPPAWRRFASPITSMTMNGSMALRLASWRGSPVEPGADAVISCMASRFVDVSGDRAVTLSPHSKAKQAARRRMSGSADSKHGSACKPLLDLRSYTIKRNHACSGPTPNPVCDVAVSRGAVDGTGRGARHLDHGGGPGAHPRRRD